MANSAQARKRARQAAETNKHNASLRSALRTAVKQVRKAIAGGDKTTVTVVYTGSVPDLFRVGRHVVVDGAP